MDVVRGWGWPKARSIQLGPLVFEDDVLSSPTAFTGPISGRKANLKMHYQKTPQPATSITGMDESAWGPDMQNQGLQKFALLALDSHLVLPPGSYSMVAYGFSGANPDGNESLQTKTWTTNDGGGLISFTGSSRHGGSPGILPPDLDTGSADSYAAGTFQFSASRP